ncbi:MAG: hypothetical protein KC620_25825, partial [Myxococcales bacterium]|nr:hypothetical protein [Myxococcales bacterium]
ADAALSVRDGRLWYEGPVTDPPPAGTVRIQDARGRTHERRFHLDGPGRAWTDLPEGPVEVLEVSSPSSRGAVLTRLVRPPSPEVQTTGPAPERLALQAAITGGQILTAPDALDPVFAARGHRGGVPWPLCAALLAIALVLLDAARWAGARFGIQKSVEYGRNWRAFWFLRSRESRGSR